MGTARRHTFGVPFYRLRAYLYQTITSTLYYR
jgi:hypothetical protein